MAGVACIRTGMANVCTAWKAKNTCTSKSMYNQESNIKMMAHCLALRCVEGDILFSVVAHFAFRRQLDFGKNWKYISQQLVYRNLLLSTHKKEQCATDRLKQFLPQTGL